MAATTGEIVPTTTEDNDRYYRGNSAHFRGCQYLVRMCCLVKIPSYVIYE